MKNTLKIVIGLILSLDSYALVNYSKSNSKQSVIEVRSDKNKRSFRGEKASSIVFDLESETFTNKLSRDKFDLYKLHLGSNLFNGVNFYLKSEIGKENNNEESFSFGNSELITMIDWIGHRGQGSANLYVIAGFVFPGSNEGIGHDRNDQVLGLVTQRNFGMMTASASFVHYFLGDSETTSLSAYDKAELKLNYSFSPIVKIGLDVSFVNTVGLVNDSEKQAFTEYSPYLHIGLTRSTNLKLGAKYASKNLEAGSFENFKQWDIGSFTGNSIYASLGFSI
jgi:hypothetical protein